jgi:precorrin-6x reductase
VNPRDRLPSAGKRWTDPAEALAQQVTDRVVDLVVGAVDVNELAARVDVNAILSRVDFDAVLRKIDLNILLSQVDVNGLAQQIDVAALVEKADIGAIVAQASGGMAREAIDAVRCQTAGLDQVVDGWVRFLLRRKDPAPPPLLPVQAGP